MDYRLRLLRQQRHRYCQDDGTNCLFYFHKTLLFVSVEAERLNSYFHADRHTLNNHPANEKLNLLSGQRRDERLATIRSRAASGASFPWCKRRARRTWSSRNPATASSSPGPIPAITSLLQNADLALVSGWVPTIYQINTANGTNSITITSPTGYLFFHLSPP